VSESAVKRLYAVGPKEVAVLAVRVVLQVELDLVSRPEVAEAVVVLRFVDGLSYDEIAKRVACSEEAVRTRVSRGLRALADGLAATSEPYHDVEEC
jgi:DNA-directed RNA polymerase specialized sigma24 family protein